eukprot:1550865-Rhodomonas_salina.9
MDGEVLRGASTGQDAKKTRFGCGEKEARGEVWRRRRRCYLLVRSALPRLSGAKGPTEAGLTAAGCFA